MNALKTGIYSKSLTNPGEDPGCLTGLGISRFNRSNRSLTVKARLRRLLIQRELPSRDRQGAVAG